MLKINNKVVKKYSNYNFLVEHEYPNEDGEKLNETHLKF
jgi:hypothetical protein